MMSLSRISFSSLFQLLVCVGFFWSAQGSGVLGILSFASW